VTRRTVDQLRATFDAPAPFTIGLEEEVLLGHPETLELVPAGAEVVARAADPRIKLELPAAQVELMTRPHHSVADAIAELRELREKLAGAAAGIARPLAAAVHPTAPAHGLLNAGGRYDAIGDEYASIAHRQLVCALQVHVAVGGADRTLAVYNALRARLPLIAALAAAAPFHEGVDTGLASIRPVISAMLPRQGMPPAIPSWEAWLQELEWGARAGVGTDEGRWWWELRPHRTHGTLELRVPDVQPTLEAAAAVATTVHALVRHLAGVSDGGADVPTWRLEENRWSALRHGVEGEMADLETGERRPTRELLDALLVGIEPHADGGLDAARALVERNTAIALRAQGVDRAASWLADRFLG
jgi:carboxylate-amine ligase